MSTDEVHYTVPTPHDAVSEASHSTAHVSQDDLEPRAGFDVCMPTPGLSMTEKLWGGAAAVWKPLCTPTYPCRKKGPPPPFFGKDAKPALFITLMMGFQHMLAMLGGVITPPRLLANEGCLLGRDPDLCKMTPYLISSAMIASGLLTIVQVIRIKLAGGYFIGTGLISVMGPSFTFLPIGQTLIAEAIAAGEPGSEVRLHQIYSADVLGGWSIPASRYTRAHPFASGVRQVPGHVYGVLAHRDRHVLRSGQSAAEAVPTHRHRHDRILHRMRPHGHGLHVRLSPRCPPISPPAVASPCSHPPLQPSPAAAIPRCWMQVLGWRRLLLPERDDQAHGGRGRREPFHPCATVLPG